MCILYNVYSWSEIMDNKWCTIYNGLRNFLIIIKKCSE